MPVYPAGHGPQVREPGVLVQTLSGSHAPLPVRHSLTSMQPDAPPPL